MKQYDRSAARKYTIVATGLKPPSSNWEEIKCPFCGAVSRSYVWSLHGGGKVCINKKCGAKHTKGGVTFPVRREA